MSIGKLLAVVGGALILAACGALGDGSRPTASGPPERPAAGQPVPLAGLYAIEWTGAVSHIGVPVDIGLRPGERNAWVFRTSCDDDGCVATGGGVADNSASTVRLAAVRIGDYVDGRWSIVWRSAKGPTCAGADGKTYSSPVWTVFDITDDLTMTATLVGTGDCPFIEVHHPTITRADDSLLGAPVPDPADQPARIVPGGAGFAGDYTLTRTPRDGGVVQLSTREVTTTCLRAESRCISTSVDDDAAEFSVFEFDGDAFSRRATAVKQPCGTGGDGVAAVTETLQSTGESAPLRTLSGERTATFSAGCAGSVTDDVTYTMVDD
ncbi:hypothetical protein [Mycolicibacterium arenosum]|uniref:Lipoprotein n=1 Tax=Mycolicibacterium arenosum TaxID=2952157 RepID=A0ABT1M8M8_9MYCO|nr:hypothetical protein [Mycolicibacterium sp. CAU 1645]MCP9275524.1 hypothetical protein [Mycolicibacterium sp. CAU 1645]